MKEKVYCGGCGKRYYKLSDWEKKFMGKTDYIQVCVRCSNKTVSTFLGCDIRRVIPKTSV